mgnify:CR=1 FL=1
MVWTVLILKPQGKSLDGCIFFFNCSLMTAFLFLKGILVVIILGALNPEIVVIFFDILDKI